jgi:hypothetical protein
LKDLLSSIDDERSISPILPARSIRTPSPSPLIRPNRGPSPNPATLSNSRNITSTPELDERLEAAEQEEAVDDREEFSSYARPVSPTFTGSSTNSGRTVTGFPRTVPLSPSKTGSKQPVNNLDSASLSPPKFVSVTLGRSSSSASARSFENANLPLKPTSTGTRYGTALGGSSPSPNRQWGGVTPQCPRCGKSVYFAEQVRQIVLEHCLYADQCFYLD